ncbi:MAG: DUF5320 domain-containing protein [Endomicrobiaceae bacterium]
MPRLDGTGPNGQGPATGRGIGFCGAKKAGKEQYYKRGLFGRGCGRGFLRGIGFSSARGQNIYDEKDIDYLNDRAISLQKELESVNKIIDSLQADKK